MVIYIKEKKASIIISEFTSLKNFSIDIGGILKSL